MSLIQNTNPDAIQDNILKNDGRTSETCTMKEFFDKSHKALFDAASDGILLVAAQSGKISFSNQVIHKMLGYSMEELLQLSISDIYTEEFFSKSKNIVDSINLNGSHLFLNVLILRKDSSVLFVDIKVLKIELEGTPYHLVYLTDKTEKTLYEDALRESEERWKFAIDGSDLGLWDWYTSNNRVFFSKKWKEMLGYQENEIGETVEEWAKRVHPNDIERCYKDLDDHFRKRNEYYSNEHRVLCKNGEYKWVHVRGKVIHWSEDGRPLRIIGTQADISQRKKFEDALRQERDMFISGVVVTFKWKNDNKLTVEYVSPNVKQVLGYSPEEFIKGDILYTSIIHKEDLARVLDEANMNNNNDSGRFEYTPYRLISKNGNTIWVLNYKTIIRDEVGKIINYLGYIVDITEQKIAEEGIQASLKEKDILLKEIHHRVKNNLQVIVSLLSLQEDLITDPNVLNVFQDIQGRIRSMAIMYEHMHKTGKFESVNIKNYVDSMVRYLSNIFVKDTGQILIDPDIEPLELDMDTMVPIGLIISELFSNSLKYAFPGGIQGSISISMKKIDDNYILCVSDNGVGLPDDFDSENLKSLGLRLVKIFVKQIKGSLDIIKQERGVKFIIQFNRA